MQTAEALPTQAAVPEPDPYEACTRLAREHYENFPVGRLVPKKIRPHVHAVYAFARVADDLADEGYADPRLRDASSSAPTEAERQFTVSNSTIITAINPVIALSCKTDNC